MNGIQVVAVEGAKFFLLAVAVVAVTLIVLFCLYGVPLALRGSPTGQKTPWNL